MQRGNSRTNLSRLDKSGSGSRLDRSESGSRLDRSRSGPKNDKNSSRNYNKSNFYQGNQKEFTPKKGKRDSILESLPIHESQIQEVDEEEIESSKRSISKKSNYESVKELINLE